ncbi:hypothetical protein HK101_007243 [Irineochytrium annulatum]|nr:hypothetical protein HK101_007243 [Irineochytrium annulatum]
MRADARIAPPANRVDEGIVIPGRKRPIPYSAINQVDRSGRTPIFKFASTGDLEAVTTLILAGADVNIQDNAGWTPLHEASLEGERDVVDLLIKYGADVNCVGMEGDTPLHDAVSRGHHDVVELLLTHGSQLGTSNKKGETPADMVDDDESMRKLLNKWRDMMEKVSEVDGEGRTMLHKAAAAGDVKAVRKALKYGAEIDYRDNVGWAPLHEAAYEGHSGVVAELCLYGAEVDAAGGLERLDENPGRLTGVTPLMDAVERLHVECVKVLLEYGANADTTTTRGKRAADFLPTSKDVKVSKISELLAKPRSSAHAQFGGVVGKGHKWASYTRACSENIAAQAGLASASPWSWGGLEGRSSREEKKINAIIERLKESDNTNGHRSKVRPSSSVDKGSPPTPTGQSSANGNGNANGRKRSRPSGSGGRSDGSDDDAKARKREKRAEPDNQGSAPIATAGTKRPHSEIDESPRRKHTISKASNSPRSLNDVSKTDEPPANSKKRALMKGDMEERGGSFESMSPEPSAVRIKMELDDDNVVAEVKCAKLEPESLSKPIRKVSTASSQDSKLHINAKSLEKRHSTSSVASLPAGSKTHGVQRPRPPSPKQLISPVQPSTVPAKKKPPKKKSWLGISGYRKSVDDLTNSKADELKAESAMKEDTDTSRGPSPVKAETADPANSLDRIETETPSVKVSADMPVSAVTTVEDPVAQAERQAYRRRKCLPLYSYRLASDPATPSLPVVEGAGGKRYMVDLQVALHIGLKSGREVLERFPAIERRVATMSQKLALQESPVSEVVLASLMEAKGLGPDSEVPRYYRLVEGRRALCLSTCDVQLLDADQVWKAISEDGSGEKAAGVENAKGTGAGSEKAAVEKEDLDLEYYMDKVGGSASVTPTSAVPPSGPDEEKPDEHTYIRRRRIPTTVAYGATAATAVTLSLGQHQLPPTVAKPASGSPSEGQGVSVKTEVKVVTTGKVGGEAVPTLGYVHKLKRYTMRAEAVGGASGPKGK